MRIVDLLHLDFGGNLFNSRTNILKVRAKPGQRTRPIVFPRSWHFLHIRLSLKAVRPSSGHMPTFDVSIGYRAIARYLVQKPL